MTPLAVAAVLLAGCRGRSGEAGGESAAPTLEISEIERVFTGGYADPSVIRFDGRSWMYLNRYGDAETGTLVYTSEDELAWTQETPVIFAGVATGRAVPMDGGVRFYYPSTGGKPHAALWSAWSADGVDFTQDPGARAEPDGADLGGPTLFEVEGRWRMLFHETRPAEADPQVNEGWIRGAWSDDGLAWALDEQPSLEGEDSVEGVDPAAQVLHPFVFDPGDGFLWMLYNAHARLYAARSSDGERWEKQGSLDTDGADACALPVEDGAWRLWFGRYDEQTSGEVYTALLRFTGSAG